MTQVGRQHTRWLFVVALVLLSAALARAEAVPALSQRESASRFGTIEIARDEADDTRHRLYFNQKEIFQYEGLTMDILKVFHSTERDYVILATYSGSIACPAQVVIVELTASRGYTVSEEFGSCSDLIKAELVKDAVMVEMPRYAAHPELLPKRELRSIMKTKEVYTWSQGKLVKKRLPDS